MKIHLSLFISAFATIIFTTSCSENTDNSQKEAELQQKEAELNQKEIALNAKQLQLDSIENEQKNNSNTKAEEKEVKDKNDLSGQHNLTLQWISWQAPGKVNFTPIGEDEYEIEGQQKGRKTNNECPDCYLNIKGTISKINPKVLRFTGRIESSVHHIQNGEPCIKEGTFDFVSTGSRKYWRCQNMNGCDGVTDYVDIYFK